MHREYGRFVNAGIAVFAFFIFNAFFVKSAVAQGVYGCPDEKIVMFRPGTCTDGSGTQPVEEGYICEGKKVILDTLTAAEKEQLRILGDNKLVVVVYGASGSGRSSFSAGRDNNAQEPKKNFVELKFACGDRLSAKSLGSGCRPLGDKTDEITERRNSMRRSIDDSWPKFYDQHKQAGAKDEDIKRYWEIYKRDVYKEYNYDPKTDKFMQ